MGQAKREADQFRSSLMAVSVQALTAISNTSSSTSLHETYNITVNPQFLSPEQLDEIVNEAARKGARVSEVQLLRMVRASMGQG